MKKMLFTLFLLSGTASAAGTFTYALSGDLVTLDPADNQDNNSSLNQIQMYDRLIGYTAKGDNYAPRLALTWSRNANATVWTFKLRQGVKFTDGTPFNADAALFNLLGDGLREPLTRGPTHDWHN